MAHLAARRNKRQGGHRHSPYMAPLATPGIRSVVPGSSKGNMTVVISEGSVYVAAIANLHWNVSETDLSELFGQAAFPGFLGARILFDAAGRSEGRAVCTYDNEATAQAAASFFSGRSFDGMSMEVTYAGEIQPDSSSKNSTAVVTSSSIGHDNAGNGKSAVLSRLGGRPVQSRLGPAPSSSSSGPQSINSRLGDHVDPPPQSTQRQKKSKKRAPKHAAPPPQPAASAMALDKDLDQYMKMPHKAPDPRQMISYDDVTPPQDDYLLM